MLALVVEFRIHPGHVADFAAAIAENARASLAHEPGCRHFDVCRHEGDPCRFMFYETDVDQAVFAAHQQTAHYARWRAAVDGIMPKPRAGSRWTAAAYGD